MARAGRGQRARDPEEVSLGAAGCEDERTTAAPDPRQDPTPRPLDEITREPPRRVHAGRVAMAISENRVPHGFSARAGIESGVVAL